MIAAQAPERPTLAWEFLDEISDWTLRVVALVALVGAVAFRNLDFAVGCMVGGCTTVWIVHHAAQTGLRGADYDVRPTVFMVVGRLVVVAVALSLAFLAPTLLDLGGTVVGIVSFDLTLAVGGSLIALRHGFGEKEGR